MISNRIQRGERGFKTTERWPDSSKDKVSDVMSVFRCRQVAPALSADGTWLRASSSCGSGAETNQITTIRNKKRGF